MKKILEYKVYDLLKDKDNEVFLDKVKKENPELYARFLNIVGNKGLEVAKQKYQEYDPEYIELKKKEEKEEKLRIKRENSRENKKEYIKNILSKLKPKIEEVEDVLSNTKLKNIVNIVNNDDRIIKYLNSSKAKVEYVNDFKSILKKPNRLEYELKYTIKIDTINFLSKIYSFLDDESQNHVIIQIIQYYDLSDKKTTYTLYLNLFTPEWDDFIPSVDANKRPEFINQRYMEAKKLNKSNVEFSEILDSLKRLSILLDDRIYQKWYSEWELKSNANKYNL